MKTTTIDNKSLLYYEVEIRELILKENIVQGLVKELVYLSNF